MLKSRFAAAAVAASVTFSVSASPFSDFYVFGDSLFDTGNLGGRATNRVGPDYENSPFGPVSPDLFAPGVDLERATPSAEGGNNYAVGGNRSLQTLQSITAETSYEAPIGGSFNSLFYNLERRGQAFDRDALYVLDGGGNDVPDLVLGIESTEAVASNMVDAAMALKDRGAKYVILTNVPSFGYAPDGVLVQDFANAAAAEVNELIREKLGSANVLIFDAYALLEEMVRDPRAYGIGVNTAEVSYACFDSESTTCSQGNVDAKIDGANPDPDQFLFNDGRHPTTIGQQIVSDYVLASVYGATEIAQLPEIGLDTMQAHWRAARPVMRSNRWDNGTPDGAFNVWGGFTGHDSERDGAFGDTGDNELTQYDMGVNYRFDNRWYLGAMLGRSDSELKFDRSKSNYEMESLGISLLSGFRGERWFIEGALSYSDLDYDNLKRSFSLGPVQERTEQADTSGEALGAAVSVGYNLFPPDRSYRLGPLLGYEYVRVETDGYREKSGSATALQVDDQEVKTGIANVGMFGELELDFCNCEVYSELIYQDFGQDGSVNPRVGFATQEGNFARLPGYERDDDGWRWDAGLQVKLMRDLTFDVSAGVGDTDSNETAWVSSEFRFVF